MASSAAQKAPKRTYTSLASRLKQIGFESKFVHCTLVPEWWDKDAKKELLSDFEFEVARFLRMPIEDVRNPEVALRIPDSNACLRSPKDTDKDSLRPAIYAATTIANAVVRNLKSSFPRYVPLPISPEEFRSQMGGTCTLELLMTRLWMHGVPVVSIRELPNHKFKALATWAIDRPVIVIGKQDGMEPATLINLAHEVGHVAMGHISEGNAIVEGDDSKEDTDSPQEKEAWAYSTQLTTGVWRMNWTDFQVFNEDKDYVQAVAQRIGNEHRIDPSLVIHLWAISSSNPQSAFGTRKYLLKVLNKFEGAQDQIRNWTKAALNLEDLSESDETLLRACLPTAPHALISM